MNNAFNLRMNPGESLYIWQSDDWPQWRYDLSALAKLLTKTCQSQSLLLDRLIDIRRALRDQTNLAALTDDVVKSSEIEGELLNVASVRSAIARRLSMDTCALAPAHPRVEGIVEVVLDAASRNGEPLTAERLFGWHAALFPTGYSGMSRITVGQWRDDADGPMQIVSGQVNRHRVHFQAPPANTLPAEMTRFLEWANQETDEPALIKAGLAHLWFATLHPFDDGNGRIARAVGDLFLLRADGAGQRFYSLSAQIWRERKGYYEVLEQTQKGSMDVTHWLTWFLGALGRALVHAQTTLDGMLGKARFWQRWAGTPMNERQTKVLNRLLDDFEGKLTSSKWAAISKCSPDTALRDITELLELGVLRKSPGGGRSTGYELAGD